MGRSLLKGLSLLLGALTSCDSGTGDTWAGDCPEYGCNSSCTVTGRVVDATTHEPIMDIAVGTTWEGGAQRSDAQGQFEMVIGECCGDPPLTFQDVDGEANGGCYQARLIQVEVKTVGPGGPCAVYGEQAGEVLAELEGEPAPCEVPEDTGWWFD